MLSHDQSLRLDTWNLVGTSGTRHRHLIKECFTLGIKVLQTATLYDHVHRNLLHKVKIFNQTLLVAVKTLVVG